MEGLPDGRPIVIMRRMADFRGVSTISRNAAEKLSISAAVERIDPAPGIASTSQSGTRSSMLS
jgi:hypothetical protein